MSFLAALPAIAEAAGGAAEAGAATEAAAGAAEVAKQSETAAVIEAMVAQAA